jgi:hypothetical protein
VQRDLGLRTVGALDGGINVLFMPCLLINILKQMYKNVLIGSEVHSTD